jgi:hypothetical protein
MARPSHYCPALSRFNVCALYHEARRRGMPMTRLADQIVAEALRGSAGWQEAEKAQGLREQPTPYHTEAQEAPGTTKA